MMNLEELTRQPQDMTKEELERYMLSLVEDIHEVLDKADARNKNAAHRNRNIETL